MVTLRRLMLAGLLSLTAAHAAWPAATLTAGDATALPGDQAQVAVTLDLGPGDVIATLQFNLTVVPQAGAPHLVSAVTFTGDLSVPPSLVLNEGLETVLVGWLLPFSPPLATGRIVGRLGLPVPASAGAGATYGIEVRNPSATSDGETDAPVAGVGGRLVVAGSPTTTTSTTSSTATTTRPAPTSTTTSTSTTTTASSTSTTSTTRTTSTTTTSTTRTTSTTTTTSSTSSTSTSTTSSSTSSSSTSTTSTTTTAAPTTTTVPLPVCGNGILEAGEDCDPPGSLTCPSNSSPGGTLLGCQVGCDCTGLTFLAASADVGATVLAVRNVAGFTQGDSIRINPGGANQEDNTVAGFGSLLLSNALAFEHASGEIVAIVTTTTSTTTMVPTTTTTTTTAAPTTTRPPTTTTTSSTSSSTTSSSTSTTATTRTTSTSTTTSSTSTTSTTRPTTSTSTTTTTSSTSSTTRAPSTSTTSTTASTSTSTTRPANRPPVCSAATAAPTELWPPNNQFVDVRIAGVTDPDGDGVTIVLTRITHDELLGRGLCPAATGVGTAVASLRAARAGQGDGRVYHLTFRAADTRGGQCSATVTVCVPHDQGGGRTCRDQGPAADATERTCAPGCDDRDPCVAEACVATPGRLDAPGMRFGAVRCAFVPQRLTTACAAISAAIQQPLEQASALVERAAGQSRPRRARRLVSRAVQATAKAGRRVAHAGARGTLAPECAAGLRTALDDARARARRWLAAQ